MSRGNLLSEICKHRELLLSVTGVLYVCDVSVCLSGYRTTQKLVDRFH